MHLLRQAVKPPRSFCNFILVNPKTMKKIFISFICAACAMVSASAQDAQTAAAEAAGKAAVDMGMKKVEVYVKGLGSGRETAIRSLQTAGLEITSISDVTPVPHNGCRPPKRPRG